MQIIVIALLALFVLPNTTVTQPDNWKVVREKTQARLRQIAESTRGCIGLSVIDLTSGERFDLNENLLFPQASAIKIPIMWKSLNRLTKENSNCRISGG